MKFEPSEGFRTFCNLRSADAAPDAATVSDVYVEQFFRSVHDVHNKTIEIRRIKLDRMTYELLVLLWTF